MSNLQSYYHSKLDFQKVDQHTGGKWLIHGTKRHKYPHDVSRYNDKQQQCHFTSFPSFQQYELFTGYSR